MNPNEIPQGAREAAASCYNKMTSELPGSLYALRHNEGVRLICLRLIEECAHAYAQQRVEEKTRGLRKDLHHHYELLQVFLHKFDDHADGAPDATDLGKFCNEMIGHFNESALKEVQTHKQELATLREVAKELADCCNEVVAYGSCDCDRTAGRLCDYCKDSAALARYAEITKEKA